MKDHLVDSLIEDLRSPTESTQYRAVQQLRQLGSGAAEAIPVLVRILGNESIKVASAANEAISQIGSSAIPRLLQLMKNPQDEEEFRYDSAGRLDEFRLFAAEALAGLGPIALPHLLKAIEDPDAAVRDVAIEALPRMGIAAESAVPYLEPLLHDPDWVQPSAISLARIAALSARPEQSPAFQALLAALHNGAPALRREVISAFDFLGEKITPAIPVLAEASQDPDDGVRENARALLTRLGVIE